MKLKQILNEMELDHLPIENNGGVDGLNKTGLKVKNLPPDKIQWLKGKLVPGDKIYIVVDNDWQNPKRFKILTYLNGRGTFEKRGIECEFKLKVDRNTDKTIEIIWFEEVE